MLVVHGEALGLVVGAVVLGAIHGIEPGHGWPIAASYALERTNKWLYGFVASLIIGIGHLVSSIAMVGVFFYAKTYFNLAELNDPITILGTIQIGGPLGLVAGVLLIGLGLREYSHDHAHAHEETDSTQEGAHDDHDHTQTHDGTTDSGLVGLAWVAFVLGFAHEEEFEIIALCTGSTHCLELMSIYAITVIMGIVSLTLLLIAGYEHFEERVERYTPYLPVISAAVLIVMGVGFIMGVF